jgi:hypothetical protein
MNTWNNMEKDIQDYLDGTFQGDVQQLEEQIQQNSYARHLLSQYRMLFETFEHDPVPEMEMDLSHHVQRLIEKKLERKEKRWTMISFSVLGLLLVLAILWCGRFFTLEQLFYGYDPVIFFLCMTITFAFIVCFQLIEFQVSRRKFTGGDINP